MDEISYDSYSSPNESSVSKQSSKKENRANCLSTVPSLGKVMAIDQEYALNIYKEFVKGKTDESVMDFKGLNPMLKPRPANAKFLIDIKDHVVELLKIWPHARSRRLNNRAKTQLL